MSTISRFAGLLLALLGCVQPWTPAAAVSVQAPAGVDSLWAQMQSCTGRSGDVRRVQWYVVEGSVFPSPDGEANGWWASPHHIYLASAVRDFPRVIQHEMVHDLTQEGRHGPVFDRCGVR